MLYYFLIPLLVGWTIQLLKIIIDYSQEKRVYVSSLRRAWWFPSVHSWISTSIATLMFFEFWLNSAEFAIAFTFSFLFWYDSMNIRYEAWKHAKYLNKISSQLSSVLEFGENKYIFLKERLWHTFLEVLWWIIIWFALTSGFYIVLY